MPVIEPKSAKPRPRPPGHVLVPAAAIGSLSIVLAVGLHALGILDHLNAVISKWLSEGKDFPKSLPAPVVWLVALFFAFGISLAILNVSGTWRRVVLWVTATVLVMGWAPVLALAAREPEIAAVFVAVLWSGICALVYAGRHQMACDEMIEALSDETR